MSNNLYACPELPEPTTTQLGESFNDLVTAAGIQACQTDNENFAMDGSLGIGFIDLARISIQYNRTKTIGCEQIVMLSKKYRQITHNISCIINRSEQVVQTGVTAVNSLSFIAKNGGKIRFSCPGGLNLFQGVELKVIQQFNLTSEEEASIENETKTFIEDVVKVVQDSESGLGATPQGQKTISETLTDIQSTNYSKKVSDTIKSIKMNIFAGNNIQFITEDPGSEIWFEGGACQINQNTLIDFAAQAMVSTLTKDSLSNLMDLVNKTATEIDQKAISEGIPNIFANRWEGVLKYFFFAVAGIVIIVIIIAILMLLLKKGKNKQPISNPFSQLNFKHNFRKFRK